MAEKTPRKQVRSPHALEENIEAIRGARRRADRKKNWGDRVADWVTAFSGSMIFVYLHIFWFGLWIAANLIPLGIPQFDPFPFSLLTMIVSLEAIFLSTFVLISQNHAAKLDSRRADLDLQIDLLAEHEVTQLLCLVAAIAKKLEVPLHPADLEELEQDVDPDALLEELEQKLEE